jgi:hypothetical protein
VRYTTEQFGETTNLLGQFTAARPGAKTFVTASPTTQFTVATHPYTNGDGPHKIRTSAGDQPSGLSVSTDYWIYSVDVNTIQFHTTKADALAGTSPVDGVDSGTGTHTILSAVQMTLIDVDTDAAITLDDGDTVELTTSTRGGFSTYKWNTGKVTTPATDQTEYEYIMEDRYTGLTAVGKLLVGGFPDESAIQRYQGRVWVDTSGAGTSGTTFPIGTPEAPVDNFADALTIRTNFALPKVLNVHGSVSGITEDFTNYELIGTDPESHQLTFTTGAVLNDTQFHRLGILGDLGSTGNITAEECIVGETGGTVTRFRGLYLTCIFRGTIRPRNGDTTTMLGVFGESATFDFTPVSGLHTISAGQTLGGFTVSNMTVAQVVAWVLAGGSLVIDATTTTGVFNLTGYGEVTKSGTPLVYVDTVIRGSDISTLLSSTSSKAIIDTSLTPWREVRYDYDRFATSDTSIKENFDLYDQDGTAIAGDATTGNNPLADPTVLIAERRRV